MLSEIKSKVDQAKALLNQNGKTLEIEEEARRIRNDFKHYIRRQLTLKNEKDSTA